jgi:hypothetical protein
MANKQERESEIQLLTRSATWLTLTYITKTPRIYTQDQES